MLGVEVIEIGARARAALLRAPRYDVLMRFSRGEVWRTQAGEIVWVDEEPDAFSEMGIVIRSCHPERSEGPGWAGRDIVPPHPPRSLATLGMTEVVDAAIARFLAALPEVAAHHVLGLGPGLTPAGDDFLGGFLAVRRRLGYRDVIDTTLTHEISRARLEMHMRGEGTRAEARFLRALLAGEDTGATRERLTRLGATSGADFIRGAVAAWERR